MAFACTYSPFSILDDDDDAVVVLVSTQKSASAGERVYRNVNNTNNNNNDNSNGVISNDEGTVSEVKDEGIHSALHVLSGSSQSNSQQHESDDVMNVAQGKTQFLPVQPRTAYLPRFQEDQEEEEDDDDERTSLSRNDSSSGHNKKVSVVSTASIFARMTATTAPRGQSMSASASDLCHARAKPSSMTATTTYPHSTTTEGSTREQRRYSFEDGLTAHCGSSSTLSTPRYSLPLSMSLNADNGHQSSCNETFAIPSKCRMVFHMRDEVTKIKARDGDDKSRASLASSSSTRGGLEKRAVGGYYYRPQSPPRIYPSSKPQSPANQYQQTPHYPLKKTLSGKTPKSVSFKDLEPSREISAASTSASTTIAITAVSMMDMSGSAAGLSGPHITAEQPLIILSDPVGHPPSSSIPTSSEAVAPTIGSDGGKVTECSVTSPTSSSPTTTRPSPAQRQTDHQRSMSAPSSSAFSSDSASRATRVPFNVQTGPDQSSMNSKQKPSITGQGVMAAVGRGGVELEPLVATARE
ncbi:hypothetical protein EDD11_002677 [Mortierella claussenii]|nr:hypothetical protein EDD11_002677 [Mortierella claussenii]